MIGPENFIGMMNDRRTMFLLASVNFSGLCNQCNEKNGTHHDLALKIHTLYIYKSMWTPFKLVDSAISATPVADRCIKLSTQPCNLHKQTLAGEWPY
jgi:hypothetical protein